MYAIYTQPTMTGRKILWIILLQYLLCLCSVLIAVECQTTAFNEVSATAENSADPRNRTQLPTNCTVSISDESKHLFTSMILHYKFNFVHLKLEFENFSITESDDVIEYKKWVWTYKGGKGGYQNLLLPSNYGYMSFGLLWAHTYLGPMRLKLSGSGTCTNLSSGNKTDIMITKALANMTSEIASYDDVYNSSYWCYHFHIKEGIIKFMCENIYCPHPTFEYKCCKYTFNFLTKHWSISCNLEHYHPGTVWWNFAMFLSCLCSVSYPLLLTYICYKLDYVIKPEHADYVEMDNVLSNTRGHITEEFVFLSKNSYPITFIGTIKQALCVCHTKSKIFARLLRFIFIFVPLTILVLKILLVLRYEGNFIQAAISKGSFVSFNNLLADFETARRRFLVIFGGPHVALALFVLLSCIFIQLPCDLESFLVKGLFNFESLGLSPLTLGLETKCHLSGLKWNNMTGFKQIHYTLSSNLLLLLNKAFWKHTLRMFVCRWKKTIYPLLKQICSSCLLKVICVPLIFGYVVFCTFELAITLLVYLFPVVCFTLILCKAYVNAIIDFCKYRSNIFVKGLRFFLIPFTVLALAYTWYIYCLVIYQCMWLFMSIILFTYSGIIAYPRISYGYLILVFMTIYYMIEIFNQFGKNYQKLLFVTIKATKNVNLFSTGKTVEIQKGKGISKKLWDLVIERHQAMRLKVASTLLQLAVLISVLYVSVDLLEKFNQFQELSVISHVFTVLAVCALPKIIRSVYMDKLCGQNKKKLVRDIENTVQEFLEDNIEDHVSIYRTEIYNDYEEI